MKNNSYLIITAVIIVIGVGAYIFIGPKEAVAPQKDRKDNITVTPPVVKPTTNPPSPTPIPKKSIPPTPSGSNGTPTGATTVFPKPAPSDITTVVYTSQGFSPQTIEVKAGQVVKFVNNGTLTMWIKSNPHPTHDIYEELNMDKPVGTGGTYTFAFTRIGTWGYHNHANPNKGGAVIVKP